MAGPQMHQFADLVAATLNDLGPYDSLQQIAQNRQDYEVLSRWFTKERVTIESGVRIQRNLMVGDGTTGPAEHNAPTDEDEVNLTDILKQMVVPWVHAQTKWMVVRQHMLVNRQPAAILNAIEAQRNYAMLKLHEEMERKAWQSPPSSANTTDPWAVKYWVVQNATIGFNGGSPTGDNMIAGINLTTLPVSGQYNNYSGTYSALTAQNGLPILRTLHRKIGFRSPVTMKQYYEGSGDKMRVYCNETSIGAFENVLYANADLSLKDVSSVDGLNMSFKRNPIVWIPTLDDDTNNPIYFIDHGTFFPVALDGDYLTETRNMAPRNHNIEQYFIELSYNYVNIDRRRNGVVYQA